MNTGGIIALVIFLLLIGGAVGWIVFTRLPPPSLKSYIPFLGSSSEPSYGLPQPRAGGVVGWFSDRIRSLKNNRTAAGAYEGQAPGGAAGRRGFGPLDPDEAWDTRVGHEADGYGPSGYYEEQELGLASHNDTSYGGSGGGGSYPMNLAATPGQAPAGFGGHEERGRPRSRGPGAGGGLAPNPFDDDAEPSNISMRGVSPRPIDTAVLTPPTTERPKTGQLNTDTMAHHINLQDIHDTLVSVAFEAGKMIMAANPNDISQDTKMNSADIVTETDQAVEAMISSHLTQKYPSYSFVGEETYIPGKTAITNEPTFIVDPIDGTTNFIHGFPNACVSLGFAVDRIPAVGVVYNPFQDLLFTGILGAGSYMQRNASLPEGSEFKPKRVNLGPGKKLGDLSSALVAVEWGSERKGQNFAIKTRVFQKLTAAKEADLEHHEVGLVGGGSMVHSLRSLGSAALNLCACAAGQVDLYWEGGCYPWDVCAGWCILVEAGGRMVSGNKGGWETQLDSRVYLAVRGAKGGQEEIVKEFWDVIGDEEMVYKY
ncbi:hypothetical protein V8F06_003656 [Rhypophila decipiens]